jgi:NADH-quinone oxidoreductase subunit L
LIPQPPNPAGENLLLNVLVFSVLLLPLCGFTVLALFGDWIKRDKESRGASIVACVVVLLAFGAAVGAAWQWHDWYGTRVAAMPSLASQEHEAHATPYFPYEPILLGRTPGPVFHIIEVGGLYVRISMLIDQLSIVMLLVVTGIGSLIHLYSLGYMSHDEERVRYFSYLNLFTFFMLMLVLGGSLPLMFIGWEGVGLCSYLLIGFWFKKKSASDAGKKAFIVNRIGDAGLLLAMAFAFSTFGTLDLFNLVDGVTALAPGAYGAEITAITLLLFLGACGKSAQIPLHVWLPDAMEGPTPVSALIHAATMVTAGVYMVARLSPLFVRADTTMAVVAIVGTATALMAASVALVQTDIKKVLAYSTVSQLGYMFIACGVGAFGVAVFHLFTHAFFKALLFLGSGSVIHALSGEQDMRQMGGLRKKIPWTFWTMLIGTVAIAGIPPFAGYFSKDAILAGAYVAHRPLIFGIGLLTALLTAFYMWRMMCLTFFGTYRGPLESHAAAADDHGHGHGHDHGHGHAGIHESPWTMLLPLVLLAIGSTLVGWIDIPAFLAPALRAAAEHGAHPGWLPYLATATALAGIVGAYYLYLLYPDVTKRLSESFAPLRRVLEAKWGFDLAYDWFARRVVVEGTADVLWKGLDVRVIDGFVNGTATVTAAVAQASRSVQSGLVRAYVVLILGGSVILLSYLLWLAR